MPLEKSASFFDDEKNEDEILQKTLKVCNKPYKDKYVPGINIQGKYLNAYGFNTGDKVFVQVAENKILIEKILNSGNGIE